MKTTAIQVILLAAAAWCVYWPCLSNEYVWDDHTNIYENRALTEPDAIRRIWTTDELYQYYPLTFTSYYLEYVFGGRRFDPRVTHAVNIALQLLNAVVLLFAGRRLGLRAWAAWLLAALFLVHPIQVESVAWATERKNLLSGSFFLLSLLAYLRFFDLGRRGDYFLSLALFLMAGLSKSVTMTLPGSLLLLELVRRRTPWRAVTWRLAPFAALSGLFAASAHHFEQVRAGVMYADFNLSWLQRVIIACRVPWHYLGNILLPRSPVFIPPRWEIDTTVPETYWPVFLTAGVLLGLWMVRKRLPALTLFAVGHFLLTLLPCSGLVDFVFMLYSFVQDHFQYLAGIGVLIVVVQAASAVYDRAGRLRFRNQVAGVLTAVVLLALGTVSHLRCYDFHDNETLYRDTLNKNPAAWLAHYNLGLILVDSDRPAEAVEHFAQTLEQIPGYVPAYVGLGTALAKTGDRPGAVEAYQQALARDESCAEAHKNLAQLLALAGRLDEAVAHYRAAVNLTPEDAFMQTKLARVLTALGRETKDRSLLEQAWQHARLAADMQPTDPETLFTLGLAGEQLGRYDAAAEAFRRTIESAPDHAGAANRLAGILKDRGQTAAAVAVLRESLKHTPDKPNTLLNLARLLATCPDESPEPGAEALALAERAVAILGQPTPRSHFVLAAAYAAMGRFEDATQAHRQAVEEARAAGKTRLLQEWSGARDAYLAHRPYCPMP
jgi:tetratricopeptide (TPR) repeat protein